MQITSALQNGHAATLFARASAAGGSPHQLAALRQITRGSFTMALDHILLVAAIVAFVCGVLSFALIRQKDFVQHAEPAAVA